MLIHQGQEAYAEHPKEKAKEDLCAVGSGGSNEGDHAEQSCSPCVDLRLQQPVNVGTGGGGHCLQLYATGASRLKHTKSRTIRHQHLAFQNL